MNELRQHPEVEAEINESVQHLEARSLWVADDFIEELRAAMRKIRLNPKHCHFTHQEYRRCNIPRFHHAVIYRQLGEDVVYVIAVMHDKRHPDYWKHRIIDDLTPPP
ncbi:type II toxin-antitoxin system RelE/ParE family toxin [Prosthecobacter sp.]